MAVSALTPVVQSVYFSYLLNIKAAMPDGTPVGVVKDLFALSTGSPKVVAALIKKPDRSFLRLDWSAMSIVEEDRRYRLICRNIREFAGDENVISLGRQILDQQIIDINDKKIVRVNDIRLAFLSTGVFAVAVDVGTSGLLRRLGVVELFNGVLSIFDRSVPGHLILWKDIELLVQPSQKIKLAVSRERLARLHPSDLSDIIEDLDAKTRTAIFTALDEEKAAHVLEEMEEEAKVSLLEDLPVEKAADVLEKMPSDEVADILDDLTQDQAQQLLAEMNTETSAEVRELMEYPENQVGSFMSTDFLAFSPNETVEQVIASLRRQRPEPDSMYSLFVTDEMGRLLGSVPLPHLVAANPEEALSRIMDTEPHSIPDTEEIESLIGIISKYTMLSVPVIDADKVLKGTVVIDDVFYRMLRNRRG